MIVKFLAFDSFWLSFSRALFEDIRQVTSKHLLYISVLGAIFSDKMWFAIKARRYGPTLFVRYQYSEPGRFFF